MSGPASVHDLVQSHRITAVIYAAAKPGPAEAIGSCPAGDRAGSGREGLNWGVSYIWSERCTWRCPD